MLVATSEGGGQASDEGPPKVGDLVLIKQHGPYKDRTGRVTKVVGAKARHISIGFVDGPPSVLVRHAIHFPHASVVTSKT